MALNKESSKIVEAIENFCRRHKDDPNLFPKRDDDVVLDNTQGVIISERHEVTTSDLGMLRSHPDYYYVPTNKIQCLN